MRRIYALSMTAILALAAAIPAAADDKAAPRVSLYTNLAYLGLTALSLGGSSMFFVLPVEAQLGVSGRLSLNPSMTAIIFGNASDSYGGLMGVAECGLYFHSRGPSSSGWKLGFVPGLAYAFDNGLTGLSVGAAAGYQWALGRWYLGALAGAREVFMDGSIFIPDLKLQLGLTL